MEINATGISVVIPTHGRIQMIERLLISLDASRNNFNHASEILVVDDSPVSDRYEIEQLCTRLGARFISGVPNVREKRNLGIREARYNIILFIDSDCIVSPNIFFEHYKTFKEHDKSIAGVVGVTEFVGEDTWMWEVIRRTQFLNAFSFAERIEYPPWATCSNTSLRRVVLEELRGFETKWPTKLGGDDTDLGLRLGKAGYRLRSNPDAIVFHSRKTWNSFAAMWKRAFRWGRMDIHLYYRRHKDRVKILLPGFRHLFVFIWLVSIITAVFTLSFWPLLCPLAWFVVYLLLRGIFTLMIEKKPARELDKELAADILGIGFELGTIFEAIIRLEPACFYKSVQRGPVLPTFSQQELIVQQWAMWFSWFLTGIFQAALLAGWK